MRQRRLALENLHNDQPREHQDQKEGQGGSLKKSTPSSEIWQEEEMSYPRPKTRSEQPTDSDVTFLAMGRLVKSAWRRVSQTHMRTPSTAQNGSANDGGVGLEQELDKQSSEGEREMESDWERQRQHSHEESVKAKQMPSVEEDEVLGNAPIRLKFKRPVLVRSVSEPSRKTTTMASMFRGR